MSTSVSADVLKSSSYFSMGRHGSYVALNAVTQRRAEPVVNTVSAHWDWKIPWRPISMLFALSKTFLSSWLPARRLSLAVFRRWRGLQYRRFFSSWIAVYMSLDAMV